MRIVGYLLFLAALVAWAAANLSVAGEARGTAAGAVPHGMGAPAFQQLPSASCASTACHGNGRIGSTGGEYSTWARTASRDGAIDPHRQAYSALFNETSVRIAKKLGFAAAHEEPLCLKCHTTPGEKTPHAVGEGVGCGACHGPAEKWLTVHYLPAWKALSGREKWERYGFAPTKNTTVRTLTCLGCHAGDSTREVNHDLIAAGHPRLVFEVAGFHYHPNYRKHWTEKAPQPDFEVRAWVIGQAATLRATADLLRVRAGRAAAKDPGATWPEFAGFSCYSCHQAVAPGAKRPDEGDGRVPGVPHWESWSTAAVEVAAAYTPQVFPGCPAPSLAAVRELQALLETLKPKPELVCAKAAAAVAQLDAWLADLYSFEERLSPVRLAPDLPGKMTRALAGNALTSDRRALREHDWDFLAAHALGCGAMTHSTGDTGPEPGMDAQVQGLFDLLRFPPPLGGKQVRSPVGLDRDKLRRLQQHFGNLSGTASVRGGRE
jgi:hypothetical protein